MNVPPSIGTAISTGMASMAELDTTLSLEDLYDLLEIVTVDRHNQRIAAEWSAKNRGTR